MTIDFKNLTAAEWREKLSPERFHILREKGTERAFTGKYDKNYADGEYRCAGCGELLFTNDSKYNSGCGWPAFTAPAEGGAIDEHRDVSHGMIRTEVTCAKCEYPDSCGSSRGVKKEPDCSIRPAKVPGVVQAACRAASAPRLWPSSTGRSEVANASVTAGSTSPTSVAAYAGLAAYRLSRHGPGLRSATRRGGRVAA